MPLEKYECTGYNRLFTFKMTFEIFEQVDISFLCCFTVNMWFLYFNC